MWKLPIFLFKSKIRFSKLLLYCGTPSKNYPFLIWKCVKRFYCMKCDSATLQWNINFFIRNRNMMYDSQCHALLTVPILHETTKILNKNVCAIQFINALCPFMLFNNKRVGWSELLNMHEPKKMSSLQCYLKNNRNIFRLPQWPFHTLTVSIIRNYEL